MRPTNYRSTRYSSTTLVTNQLRLMIKKLISQNIEVRKIICLFFRETEHSHPIVCQKALHSLLDVLQGLQPEDLRLKR
jgi:hypothetical protein